MKSKIIKILLSSVLSVWVIAGTVFALNTVNTWDTLTASSWNEIVNKLTSFDTNSTDLVTKSYVDSAISAGSGLQPWTIDWRDCETKSHRNGSSIPYILSCSTWYELVLSNISNSNGSLSDLNSLSLWYASLWSIKCCKINQ